VVAQGGTELLKNDIELVGIAGFDSLGTQFADSVIEPAGTGV